uniref:activating transcription factor 7-interacting protein 2 isoform X2 n=1 Tax=Scatophagus argus TaxID=75038 RepID=UPI001ED81E6C|nr:activating transcription factor 7-interacting protein 2 isoform X2 [Scatophagus argus]XP_046271089.1 activating transcription factor 7-interacting protein 2 isoform X2 [Scatophagus argus]
MADAQDQIPGCTGFQKPAQKTVKPSTTVKKHKHLSQKLSHRSTQRARVNIGLALKRWRALKAEYGMRSDAEVALRLLDLRRSMKSLSPGSPPSGSSDKKIKFSQSEVQTLIEEEVCRTLHRNETKLRHLVETVEQLDHEVNYKDSIQKLETRVNIITQRAEAALVYMAKKKKKSPLPSVINVDIIRSDSEDETMETESQNNKRMECKSGEIFQTMETTKKALKKMQADNKAMTAAIEDVSEELIPRVPASDGSPESKGLVKKEPESLEEKEENFEVAGQSQAEMVKKESLSPRDNKGPMPTYLKQPKSKLLHPPLPSTAFPSILNIEAALYNIPQRPEVRLALIRKPAGLSVLWNMPVKDPFAPPMESYGIFMTTENAKGSGVFSKWTMLGEVAAIPLPICVMVSKYKPGRKVCVAVVGKDKFGRYGPYSEVVTAAIPE